MGMNTDAVQRLYVAYFNRPADPISLSVYESLLPTDTVATQAELQVLAETYFSPSAEYTSLYAGLSNAQIVDKLYQNIFGRNAEPDGLTYWAAELTAGRQTVASIALQLSYSAQGTDADVVSNRIEAANSFTTALDTTAEITGYSGDAAAASARAWLATVGSDTASKDTAIAGVDQAVSDAVAAGTPGLAPQTFTMTTSADNFTGGGGDDTFNGAHSTAEKTWTVSDSIDGGDGTDTLALTFGTLGAGTTVLQGAAVTSIENFQIKNVSGQTITQDFSAVTGEQNVSAYQSTDRIDVLNLAAGTSFDIVGNGAMANGVTNIGYAAAATAADLDIMGGTTAGNVAITGAAVTSTSITSSGAANTIGTLAIPATSTSLTIDAATKLTTGAITSAGLTSVTITGAGGADLNAAAFNTTVKTIDASAATGDIDVTAGNVADLGGTVDAADLTITTGSGADEVNAVAVDAGDEISINTGGGDDIVTIGDAITNSSATTVGDAIDGGDGTDILAMASANAVLTVATNGIVGFEELTITDALAHSITPTLIGGGLSTVNLAAGGTGTVTGGAGSLTVNIQAPLAGGALIVSDGTLTGTSDAVTIVNEDTSADAFAGQAIQSTGYETVNIDITGTGTGNTRTEQDFGAITITADTGGTTTLNITGDNLADMDGVITAQVVDASGMTAQATGKTFDMTGNAMVGLLNGTNTLTGSAGADVLIGDANDTTNISGGAGNDDITGGSDAETINGGDGNDTIAGGGGADTINGGAGKDVITLGGTLESVDAGADDDTVTAAGNLTFGRTYAGGDGNDTLSTNAGVSSADGSGVSGFEVLSAANAGTYTLTNFGSNSFTTFTIGALGASTVAGVGSETIQITDVHTGTLTVTLANATGTSDSLALNYSSATGITATQEVVAAGVETINLSVTDTNTANAEQNVVQLTVAAATTLTITGDQGVALTGSGDISKLTTVDASGMVLGAVTETGLTMVATYNQVGGVATITGSNGVDNITGTANVAETVNLGAGADTVVFTGTASDTYTLGAGVDTVDANSKGITTAATAAFTITDVAYGDKIDLVGAATGTIANVNAATWDAAEITLGSAATFANYLDAATAGDGSTNSLLAWFYFGGDTYIVMDSTAGATFTAATDMIIKLNGTLDIDQTTVTAEVITFAGP